MTACAWRQHRNLLWIDTVLKNIIKMNTDFHWKSSIETKLLQIFTKIYLNYWKIISNNCLVFSLIALHLIHINFDNLWINIIIGTCQKNKPDKKHYFLHIFGYKNHQKISKTTQKCSTIYARSPAQLEQYLKHVEIKINFENWCWKLKLTKISIWPSKIDF